MVLADDMKNPAMEKLELVRKWSINTYKVSHYSQTGRAAYRAPLVVR